MRLIHYKGPRPNFGDDLNEILWPRLAPALFDGDGDGFLGVGTIIGMPTPGIGKLHVFSSGAGYRPLRDWNVEHKVWCVRGPLTARLLGLPESAALTDGALLAPLIAPKPADGKGIGVVPHWQTMLEGGWDRACAEAGFDLIDPMGEPAAVIAAIACKSLVLAESLHGAIIADAYDVPWIAFACTGAFSVFKWADWAASIDVRLRVTPVSPPSGRARLRHGKPWFGKWGGTMAIDEDLAARDFERHTARFEPSNFSFADARRLVTNPIRTAILGSPTLSRFAGHAASHTAEVLSKLAQDVPMLSANVMRQSRTERLLARFADLCSSQECAIAL